MLLNRILLPDTGNEMWFSGPVPAFLGAAPGNGSSLGHFYLQNSSFIKSDNKPNQKIYFYEIIFNLLQ